MVSTCAASRCVLLIDPGQSALIHVCCLDCVTGTEMPYFSKHFSF